MFLAAPLQYLKGGRFFAIGVMLYCAFISFFRGSVGTDTATYIRVFEDIENGISPPYGEPLFLLINKFLIFSTSDAAMAVKAVSLIFFFLLIGLTLRADKDERFFLMSFFMPGFAYSYSMNALRIGIASAVFLYVLHYLRRGMRVKAVIGGGISIFFHYSSVFFCFYVIIFENNLFKLKRNIFFILSLMVLIFLLWMNFDYMEDKFSLYKNFDSPGDFSGLRIIFVILFIMTGLIFGDLPKKDIFINIGVGSIFIVLFYVLARFSYAGLRGLELMAFSWPASVLLLYGKSGRNFDLPLKVGFFIGGMVFSIAIYFGYLGEYNRGDSPFLPYVFSF